MQPNIIDNLFKDIKELPTLPRVTMALVGLMENPNANAKDVNRILARDPSLATKILKIVNSAYYALPRKIANLNQAIVLLGFKIIKSVVLTASILKVFPQKSKTELFDRDRFWKHSIACACLNKAIAKKIPSLDGELAYTFGLFHDIGKLILDQFAPQRITQVIENAQSKQVSFYQSEVLLTGITHCDIAYELAKRWQLPDTLAEALLNHHNNEAIKQSPLLAVNSFANYICLIKGIRASGSYETGHIDKELWIQLGLTGEDIPKLLKIVEHELEAVEELLQLAS